MLSSDQRRSLVLRPVFSTEQPRRYGTNRWRNSRSPGQVGVLGPRQPPTTRTKIINGAVSGSGLDPLLAPPADWAKKLVAAPATWRQSGFVVRTSLSPPESSTLAVRVLGRASMTNELRPRRVATRYVPTASQHRSGGERRPPAPRRADRGRDGRTDHEASMLGACLTLWLAGIHDSRPSASKAAGVRCRLNHLPRAGWWPVRVRR